MRHALRQTLRVASTGLAFALFFTGAALLGWVVFPIVAMLSRPDLRRARRCRAIIRRSFVLFHDILRVGRVLDYDPRRARIDLPPGACVIVANHPTLLDVTAIVSALPDITFVVKQSMFRFSLLGRVVQMCGYVESGEGSPVAGAITTRTCLKRLAEGVPVLIFPEGTRSPERGLRPFKRGATTIARRAGVPLVPLVLTCEPPTLLRGQAWYVVPAVTPVMSLKSLPCGVLGQGMEFLRDAYVSFLRDASPIVEAQQCTAPSPISNIAN
jgi:1-acyl-sn-glycerol-3-phosphate acyltransferase